MSSRRQRRRAPECVAIDLDNFTPQDWIDVRAIVGAAGIDPATCDLAAPSVPLLTALIFCTLRRTEPGISPERCVRLAQRADLEVARG